ncbi:thiamine pyrophosphate-dependent enzyme [Shigella flexneri]
MFDEFAGKHKDHLGTGDVKYHQGFSSDFQTEGAQVHLALAFNPSHLEIVSPVVIGSSVPAWTACAEQQNGLPITIHGDSAVTGQGVVQETLNMSKRGAMKWAGLSASLSITRLVSPPPTRRYPVNGILY